LCQRDKSPVRVEATLDFEARTIRIDAGAPLKPRARGSRAQWPITPARATTSLGTVDISG
jgi:hypothetical protein